MKNRVSLRLICPHCFFVRRKGVLFVRCAEQPKHKQRQGLATAASDATHNHIEHDCTRLKPFSPGLTAFSAKNPTLYGSATKPRQSTSALFNPLTGIKNFLKPY